MSRDCRGSLFAFLFLGRNAVSILGPLPLPVYARNAALCFRHVYGRKTGSKRRVETLLHGAVGWYGRCLNDSCIVQRVGRFLTMCIFRQARLGSSLLWMFGGTNSFARAYLRCGFGS